MWEWLESAHGTIWRSDCSVGGDMVGGGMVFLKIIFVGDMGSSAFQSCLNAIGIWQEQMALGGD